MSASSRTHANGLPPSASLATDGRLPLNSRLMSGTSPASPHRLHQHSHSMSIRGHRSSHRESLHSLASGSPSSPQHEYPQDVPSEGSIASGSHDTAQSLIASGVQRLVKRLPFNSGMKLAFVEDDELVRSCVTNLVHLSRTRIGAVMRELSAVMETLNKKAQAFSEDALTTSLLQSQLFVLRVMSACLVHHWRCLQPSHSSYSKTPQSGSGRIPMPWSDPDPLEDALAKQVLSVMTVTLRQAVSKEDRQISAWAGLPAQAGSSKHSRTAAGGGPNVDAGPSGSATAAFPGERRDRSLLRDWDQSSSQSSAKPFHVDSQLSANRLDDATAISGSSPHQHASNADFDDADDSAFVALSLTDGNGLFVIPPNGPPALSMVPFEVKEPVSAARAGFELPPRFKPIVVLGGTQEHNSKANGHNIDDSKPMLTKAIYRYVSLIVFYVSSSNWGVVHARLRNRIAYLSSTPEDLPNAADLRMMECANLDPRRLNNVTQELNNSFLHLRKSAQASAALIIRRAVWTFIRYNTVHFAMLHATGERLAGAPDYLFDQVYSLAESTKRRQVLWPMLTALLLISPDILSKVSDSSSSESSRAPQKNGQVAKKVAFLENLRKNMKGGKLEGIAVVCILDICKAATYTPQASNALRSLAATFKDDLQARVFDTSKMSSSSARQLESSIVVDAITTFFRLDAQKTLQSILPLCIIDGSHPSLKIGLVKAIFQLVSDTTPMPWTPDVTLMHPMVCFWMRKTFKELLIQLVKDSSSSESGGHGSSAGTNNGTQSAPSSFLTAPTGLQSKGMRAGLTTSKNGRFGLGFGGHTPVPSDDEPANRLRLISAILMVWKTDLQTASHGMSDDESLSVSSLSSSGSATDEDGMLDNALKTDSILAWVYILVRASSVSKYAEIHVGALEVLDSLQTCKSENGSHSAFLWAAQKALHSCEATLTGRLSKRYFTATETVDQRHWVHLWARSVRFQVHSAMVFSTMADNERAQIPRPSLSEKLLERTMLSVSFFLGICSADSEIVTVALRSCSSIVALRREARRVGDVAKAPGDDWSTFWERLTDLNLLSTGRVARQKRIRVLLRQLGYPTPAALITWKEMLRRWSLLTPIVARPSDDAAGESSFIDDGVAAQWDNYAGFLASLGGCCLASPPPGLPNVPEHLLDPAFAQPENIRGLIDGFLQEMVDLLVSDSIWLREKVKESLGVDLDSRLSGVLLRQVHVVLGDFFDRTTGAAQPAEMFTIFVEQSIAVVQMMLNRIDESCIEWTSGVDIGLLMVLYVEYVHALGRREQALRIKTAMCQLCESLWAKKGLFAFRNETLVRNRLFQALITWSSDSQDGKSNTGKMERLQRELDVACLKIIAKLLDGLPLVLADDAMLLDDKVNWARSRQFSLYANHFIRILNRTRALQGGSDASDRARITQMGLTSVSSQRTREVLAKETTPLREFAILALSNLLASNIDSGLQHSLVLGYSEDIELRTAFMRIMTNVLGQGAAFDDLEKLRDSQGQSKLVDLIGNSDLSLALSICQSCRGWDPDTGIDRIMLSIFDSHGGTLNFLKAAVEEEIERTPSEEMVFRSNSFRTHLLSLFARTHGYDYLRSIMTPLITEMANNTRGLSFEIDPQRIDPGESAVANRARLEETAQNFINTICDSAMQVPAVMQELCRHIRLAMDRKFPNSRYQGVGGFMFLRFISPAIVAPQTIDMNLNGPDKGLRRGLLLVSKILQTLASNNLFSTHKEPFMTSLNDFLRSNVWRVTAFLDGVSNAPTDPERIAAANQPMGYGVQPRGYGIDDREQHSLHAWMYENVDLIGKELLARSAVGSVNVEREGGSIEDDAMPSGTANAHSEKSPVGKEVYERLCLTLAELGSPKRGEQARMQGLESEGADSGNSNWSAAPGPGVTFPSTTTATKSGQTLQDFYRRTGGRKLQSELWEKIFYIGPPSKAGKPVIYYSPNLQDAETIDFEGLMAHAFHTLEQLRGSDFELVIDATGLKRSNVMPPQWALYFGSIAVVKDYASRLRSVIMFNANTTARLWFDRIRTMPSSALPEAMQYLRGNLSLQHCNSLSELDAVIDRRNVALHPQTIGITSSVAEHRFSQVTMIWYYRRLLPVTFKIGGDYLQITALKGQEFFTGRLDNANEVFHLADIDDVRPIPCRGEDNAFLLTVRGGDLTFVFHSRERAAIIQALREARARVSRLRHSKALDRTLLPSDVPGALLNMAMLNIISADPDLRLSAYNLLCALSVSFNFGASTARKRLLSSNGLSLPANTIAFVAELSQDFAIAAPAVSLEFFVSFFEGFEEASPSQKSTCLHYMAPWLPNLAIFTHSSREQQPDLRRRIKEIIGNLLAITTKQPELFSVMQRAVWAHFSKLDDLIPLVIDVFCEAAIDSGLYSARFNAIVDTVVSFASMNLRGKLLARLRQATAKTALHPTALSLHDNAAWKEIATLTRMNTVLSFVATRVETYVFLPEVLHLVLLLAGHGADQTRYAIRSTVINVVHSLCTGDGKKEIDSAQTTANRQRLEKILQRLGGDDFAACFGLPSESSVGSATSSTTTDAVRDSPDNVHIVRLAQLVYEITELAAPSTDTANSWRARLTSLVTNKAFQYNPLIQSRAFILLGSLAQGGIDDDLVYQILVALRGSFSEWSNLGNDTLVIAIVSCLAKVVRVLPQNSRYLAQMFWLGVAVVQAGHVQLFQAGIELMLATLTALRGRDWEVETDKPTPGLLAVLLGARDEVSEAADRLNEETGVNAESNFSVHMAVLLIKGLRHPSTKHATKDLLEALLQITATEQLPGTATTIRIDQVGFFVALLPTATSPDGFSALLRLAGLNEEMCSESEQTVADYHSHHSLDVGATHPRIHSDSRGKEQERLLLDYIDISNSKAALLTIALITTLLSNAANDGERLILYQFLSDASIRISSILAILYDNLASALRDVLVNCQSGPTLQSAQQIAQAAVFDPLFSAQADETTSRGGPVAFLEEAGFPCLLNCGVFGSPPSDARRLIMSKLSTALLSSLIDSGPDAGEA